MSMTYFLFCFRMETAQTGLFLLAKIPAVTHEKPYKIELRVRFFGAHCLWLTESVFIKLSIDQEA